MIRRPPRSTRTDTLFPYTTLFRSKRELDFKVDHRFGDIAGTNGGAKNFFGLDNSTDIKIGFEYGITDNLNVGVARAKGATQVAQLYEVNVKYRMLRQTVEDKMPLSVARSEERRVGQECVRTSGTRWYL